jgi:L-lactate dehydrogenase complex protein LldG
VSEPEGSPMDARQDVLASIRRSLGVTGQEGPRRVAVEGRLAAAPQGVIPARGQIELEARVALFCKQAQAAAATVALVDGPDAVPAEVARFLRDGNLPATLRMGEDPRLAAMPWGETSLTTLTGSSMGDDPNAVSHACGAVAESGTVALVSGPENPTTLNFLPDNHFVVVAAQDIAGDYETVLAAVRGRYGKGQMPRTLNFVTGPSRSGDIEQTLILGAHGPRRLHIVVVKP